MRATLPATRVMAGTQLLGPAYVRARCADPKSSYGDFVALSDRVDVPTAEFLKGVVSDGIIAPGYEPAALDVLKAKKSGAFIVLEADATYEAPPHEAREIFGMKLLQDRNDIGSAMKISETSGWGRSRPTPSAISSSASFGK
jgi:phosphoribosylaminoimidazolecarboxamide formyltransferase/IMP cyclohydrolase